MSKDNRTNEEYEDLLQFMSNPGSYPHQPDSLEHVQTHISHVFIVPPYVYKIKKPADLGFLDYSSLSKRKEFCHQEVSLNRRLCSGVYLGVEAICRENGEFEIKAESEAPAGSVVEHVVKMNKLPGEYFLYQYISDCSLTSRHLDRVSDTLAEFYRQQMLPAGEAEQWGAIEAIRVNTDENFEQVSPFVGGMIEKPAFSAIRQYTERFYREHEELFGQRVHEGRMVNGHGDLHLEHIHVSPGQVCIYDCIEFNERFRKGDQASDLAYLAMDLDYNDQPKAEYYFIRQMARKLGDYRLDAILSFYKCYRAFVKGKVKSLQSRERDVPKEERRQAARTAQKYFNYSLKYALIGTSPKVLILIGVVGTGKSTLAKTMHERLNIAWYSSDNIRKNMAGVPLTERTPRSRRELLYSATMSDRTYQQLLNKARSQLRNKRSVILDATFSDRQKRATLTELMEAREVDYLYIETRAPEDTVQKRLRARDEQKEVISDARIEDYDRLKERYNPPGEIKTSKLITVNTDQPMEASLEQLYSELVKRNIES